FNSATGVVTVVGTEQPAGDSAAGTDIVTAKVANQQFVVTLNGATTAYPAAKVKRVVIRVGSGSDEVTLDPTVKIPSEIHSGTATINAGDRIQGGSGPDTIYLEGVASTAFGMAGNDVIYVSGSQSGAYAGAGNDTIRVLPSGLNDNGLDGEGGYDTIDFGAVKGGLLIRDESLGGTGAYGPGTGYPPTLVNHEGDVSLRGFESYLGGQGDDFIYGTSGANYIDGRGGNDYIRGGGGNDVLVGGAGADALYGDDGDDEFYAADKTKDFLSGGGGKDKWRGDANDVLNSVEAKF
ncbi:MAG: hypothetical protein JWO31_3489, partial [Phycisphaerales bacterium]|nr:hypothetical protein [Phycisphaerales bacterium]